jgi:hypothetical protein
MGWTCSLAGETINANRILVGKYHEKQTLGRLRRGGRIAVKWIFGKWVVRMGGGWNWLRIMSNGGLWYWLCSFLRFCTTVLISLMFPVTGLSCLQNKCSF